MNAVSPDRTFRTVLFVLLGVLGIGGITTVACCGGVIWLARNAAIEVPVAQTGVELFLDRIADGNTDSAYQGTTDAFRSVLSSEQFAGFLAAIPPDVSRASRKITFLRINTINGVSQVAFRVVSKDKSCTIVAMKENGEWKVQHLAVP